MRFSQWNSPTFVEPSCRSGGNCHLNVVFHLLFQVDRISTVKCNILRNDEKIQKMLSSVSLTSR